MAEHLANTLLDYVNTYVVDTSGELWFNTKDISTALGFGRNDTRVVQNESPEDLKQISEFTLSDWEEEVFDEETIMINKKGILLWIMMARNEAAQNKMQQLRQLFVEILLANKHFPIFERYDTGKLNFTQFRRAVVYRKEMLSKQKRKHISFLWNKTEVKKRKRWTWHIL